MNDQPPESKPENKPTEDITPDQKSEVDAPPVWKPDDTIKIAKELIRRAFEQNAKRPDQQTNELDVRDRLPLNPNMPYAVDRASSSFTILPKNAPSGGPRWLISLEGLVPGRPLGIEVVGDIVLGTVRQPTDAPDLDLSTYGADDKGVSRRHAVLRPTKSSLYLIDLKSTNGTSVNGVTAGNGVAIELQNRDGVSLGALTFMIKILASPSDFDRLADLGVK
jgi:hypothetical protein